MKNQREEEDRLSQLPQRLLHEILYNLDPKEAAQTCVLSKSWRLLESTSPNVKFREEWFTGENKKEEYLSFVETTLQRYQDQKLSLEEFWLEMSEVDSESKPLLEKWVPILMLNMGVKTFALSFNSETSACFDLPSEVFRAQLPLQELFLKRCTLSQINNVSIVDNVVFKHLETLDLWQVYIADETFEKIMSCCPLIEDVSLDGCVGLKTIKLTTADKLKRFDYKELHKKEEKDDCKIKIDVLTIEEIRIWGCPNWFHHHCHKNFLHLKDLCLWHMRLSTKSFGTFSHNFPCLEDLHLHYCYGFKEIKLSSSSIERLTVTGVEESVRKVTVRAPYILYFKYQSDYLPSSFSFTTTACGRHRWKSDLCLFFGSIDYSSWFVRLNEVLGALSQSEISLDIFNGSFHKKDTHQGGFTAPVAVENLVLRGFYPRASFQSFLNMLFRVCRPRNIIAKQERWVLEKGEDEELTKLLCKFLLQKSKGRAYYFTQPDLKEVRMELCDDDKEEERPNNVDKSSSISNEPKTMFRLKWK